jgi:hypothetical protein
MTRSVRCFAAGLARTASFITVPASRTAAVLRGNLLEGVTETDIEVKHHDLPRWGA